MRELGRSGMVMGVSIVGSGGEAESEGRTRVTLLGGRVESGGEVGGDVEGGGGSIVEGGGSIDKGGG